ncbi:MAG TPA: hypothetical protein VN616_01415 [Puia sp.]|nr:hypothetical protein [Puia sp.]
MKGRGFCLVLLLTACLHAGAQTPTDSTFSLFFNSSLHFNHANDPHINRWLTKYGYKPEPHVPISLSFEAGAMPANSRLLYSIHLSTITNATDLTAFNVGAGIYFAALKTKHLLLFAGSSFGYHADIINLNGNLPPAYDSLAIRYGTRLSLRRSGISFAPTLRLFWYPIRLGGVLQIGVAAEAGFAGDVNSRWRLGYYTNASGKYDHFRKIGKPNDQQKVSEYGFFYGAGVSLRFNLQ